MYEIIFTEQAKKQLTALDPAVRQRIGSAIERIKIRPHSFIKRLYNSKYYRLRVDNYRLILDIHDNQLIVYIIEIGHRDHIYKN